MDKFPESVLGLISEYVLEDFIDKKKLDFDYLCLNERGRDIDIKMLEEDTKGVLDTDYL